MKITLLSLIFFACGCSVFTSYPEMTAHARHAFEQGRFQEALLQLPKDPGGPDEMLYRMERGLISHTAANYSESNLELQAAVDLAKSYEDRPSLSLRSGLEGLGSMILNDKVLPYDGEGFERVLLHDYLALNYFLTGKLDDAYVEIRLAYEIQREEERRYEKTYSTQSALGRYLSGIVRESAKEPGEAYIDYKRVQELVPGNHFVQRDLLRLAERLGYRDDWQEWSQKFPDVQTDPLWKDSKAGECLVLFQCGVGPMKRPIEIPIPHPHGITKFAAPDYEPRPNPVHSLRLYMDQRSLGKTELLEDIEGVAIENLRDRIAWVVAKAAARTVAKGVLTEKLEKKHEGWGALLGTLFAIITEQADLRSWLSLPRNVQVLRTPISGGTHEFSIELLGPSGNVMSKLSLGTIKVREGERVILNLRSIGLSSFAHFVGGETLKPQEMSP